MVEATVDREAVVFIPACVRHSVRNGGGTMACGPYG
jgi:mannose-6-phosphate isomerase-like protein (cupin superfamily)